VGGSGLLRVGQNKGGEGSPTGGTTWRLKGGMVRWPCSRKRGGVRVDGNGRARRRRALVRRHMSRGGGGGGTLAAPGRRGGAEKGKKKQVDPK
jgi:hypothetical protein